MTDKELYIKAKEKYYKGSPIMSDSEFDELEGRLGVGAVGSKDRESKFSHPTKMLSMSKFQADKTTGAPPTDETMRWIDTRGGTDATYNVPPKYDGNSGNCVYINGKLSQVLSRGDGELGRDITAKVKHLIPSEIPIGDGIVEVRGEVLMKTAIFDAKYAELYANPRNFVAGILNKDEITYRIMDLSFVAYDMKHNGEYYSVQEINNLGFEVSDDIDWNPNDVDFETLFNEMLEYRSKCVYPLDGFIIKVAPELRAGFGENTHDPEWAKAIKFKPVGFETTILAIEWNVGKTGRVIPTAILSPVDIDGSTVSRVTLNNAGYVIENNIEVGTRIRIAKSGDIIPHILEIFGK